MPRSSLYQAACAESVSIASTSLAIPVTMTRVGVLCVFVLFAYVNCNLIKIEQDIGTKDVPLPREEIDNNDLKPVEPEPIDVDVLPLAGDLTTKKPCAKIGEFCTYHTECCTHACLGYMKRCVTGSGLYPDYIDPTAA